MTGEREDAPSATGSPTVLITSHHEVDALLLEIIRPCLVNHADGSDAPRSISEAVLTLNGVETSIARIADSNEAGDPFAYAQKMSNVSNR
jgi:hypothetical protein